MTKEGTIIIYSIDNQPSIEVKLINETLWLDQYQIADLFQVDRTSIVRHIRNIYKSEELPKTSTCAKITQVQKEGKRQVKRLISIYNLDLIISVGYRVNSKRGTQFRIWANKIIKNHLVKGYTTNQKRLDQLKKTIQLVNRTSKIAMENRGFIDLLSDYTIALDILDDYDHQRIVRSKNVNRSSFRINYVETIEAIKQLRQKFNASPLFGNEKDDSFKSSIAVIDQTFDGKNLYQSIEEKAANLLYLVTKNHSFTDGNKRIAAWLFVWYLNKNNFLYTLSNTKKITNSTLVALTLMIANSYLTENI